MVKNTSVLFNINPYILMEFVYNDEEFLTDDVGFLKIENGYENSISICNTENDNTNNPIETTTLLFADGRHYRMGINDPYQLQNIDNKIKLSDVTIYPNKLVRYDKIKIHILSGYTFDEAKGFLLSMYIKLADGSKFYLVNQSYLFTDIDNIVYSNPNPIKISNYIYDKFVSFNIVSVEYMLENQRNGSQNSLLDIIANQKMIEQSIVYVDYQEIQDVIYDVTTSFVPTNLVRYSMPTSDNFSDLVPHIDETNGYLSFYATWRDSGMESFIYRLNSIVGNKYYVIHDIIVSEQIGSMYKITQNINSIQTEDYDQPFILRPIVTNFDAISVKIDYIIRIHNAVDGKSIFKSSSKVYQNAKKWYKDGIKIDVGNTPPIKVYNAKEIAGGFSLVDNITEITKSKIVTIYEKSNTIQVRSDSDINPTDITTIKIDPFDNFIKFNLMINNGSGSESYQIKNVNDYYLVFIKNDGTKLYIEENKSNNINKNSGELGFKISSSDANEIISYKNNKFYVISRYMLTETTVFSGSFVV